MCAKVSNATDVSSSRIAWREHLVWDNVWPVDLLNGDVFGNDWEKLDAFRDVGYGALGVTLAGDNHTIRAAAELIGWARRQVRNRASQLALVESVGDIDAARQSGKLAVIFQFEGTRCFEDNLDMIDVFYSLGVRQTLLAFNKANSAGGGCADPEDRGLTAFGEQVVDEMERVGMLLDLSHCGRQTTLDAMARARKPVIFSHSNSAAVHDSFRNITDEQIRACAATGGLVGISGASEYLGDSQCRTETLFRHVDYMVELVGPEHVGIGLDILFETSAINAYVRGRPDEWPIARDPRWPGLQYVKPEQLFELADLLISKGYQRAQVLQILGENYRRVCQTVWN